MLKLLLPLLLFAIGTGAGIGAALMTRPDHPDSAHSAEAEPRATDGQVARDYVKLNNQFVVPIVSDAGMQALVVLSISLEVTFGKTQFVYEREPKLRDALLRVLIDHANFGGFEGAFTRSEKMDVLRKSLLDEARLILGEDAKSVLILDIARQAV